MKNIPKIHALVLGDANLEKLCLILSLRSLPLDPIISQLNPMDSPSPYFPKIHLNVILPFTPRSPYRYRFCSNAI
jgi:hypothetical protein